MTDEGRMAAERAALERGGKTDLRHCLRCGWLDYRSAVPLRLVEVPTDEQVLVEVSVASETRIGMATGETRRVPGRYAAEYRCRDVAACDERVAAYELEQAATSAPVDEELAAWVP